MGKERHRQRQNIQLRRKRARSRCNLIACPAPASPADTEAAGVFVCSLPDGEVAILRENPHQRLERLRKLQQVYAQQRTEAFNKAVREEAERIERKTKIIFTLVSVRVRALLRRKRLLEKAGLSLSGTGNLGIVKRSGDFNEHRSLIPTQDFVREVVIRAPPTKNTLLLSHQFAVSPASVWFGFVCLRAVRAPNSAARLGGSGVMTSHRSAV
ncbi:MAG: hypothetical protein QXY94_05300 [Archaeoglobaceae archaeon]